MILYISRLLIMFTSSILVAFLSIGLALSSQSSNNHVLNSSDMALFGGKLVSRAFIEGLIALALASPTPVLVPEDFRIVANGVFQSDGSLSASISGGSISPSFVLVQNCYPGSLVFFSQLFHQLGGSVNLYAVVTGSNTWQLRLTSNSWSVILETVIPYFSLCYGEKFMAGAKLVFIRSLIIEGGNEALSLALTVMYSLAVTGTSRKVTLSQQLTLLGLAVNFRQIPVFNDNYSVPSFLFIVGLWLGDGSLVLRLRWEEQIKSIWLIPLFVFAQKDTLINSHLFYMLSVYFKSMGITFSLRSSNGMMHMSIEGLNNVVKIMLPLLVQYSEYHYWKTHQFHIINVYAKLVTLKLHLTLVGMTAILEACYLHPDHSRLHPLDYWLSLAEQMFAKRDSECDTGHQMLQEYTGRGDLAGQPIGIRVVFPKVMNTRIKTFSYAKYSKVTAISLALSHRDTTLRTLLKNVL